VFKAIEQADLLAAAPGGGALAAPASLTYAQVLTREPRRVRKRPNVYVDIGRWIGVRVSDWKHRAEHFLSTTDLAPDLADDIGSAQWFRGLGTMVGLGVFAISFWPDFTALEAATATPIHAGARDEFRSQMIMPLALGADSGRHMGATPAVQPLASAPERPIVRLTATLGQGDSFGRMLQRVGVGPADAARVSELVAGQIALGDIAPGTRFDITLGRRPQSGGPRPLDRLDFRARFDLALAIGRHDGGLGVTSHPIAVNDMPLRIRGKIGAGLYRSARAAGAPVEAIRQYLQAIDQHVSLESDVSPGDEFDMVLAYRRSARGESQLGDLLYAGLESGGRPRLQLLRWGKDGQMYDAAGMSQSGVQQGARLFAPVTGRLTSIFGLRRHPILGYTRMHSGVDYGAAYGAPIFAVSDGRVSWAGRHGGHGNYVRIEHGGGLGSGYAHMSRIAVSPGMGVRAGQVIGYVGSTGLSTGPHLHFEVYQGNRKINPLSVRFAVRVQPIDKKELAAFKARLAAIRAVKPGAALASLAPRQAEVKKTIREIDRADP